VLETPLTVDDEDGTTPLLGDSDDPAKGYLSLLRCAVGLLNCHFRKYKVLQTLPDQYHRPLMDPVHHNSVMSYVANRHSTRNKRRCRVDY
jgi:hypothetical protein